MQTNADKTMSMIVEKIKSEKYPDIDSEVINELLDIHKKYYSNPEKMKEKTKDLINRYVEGDFNAKN